ncbi:putative sensory transducer protein YfmS [compost metagenome]
MLGLNAALEAARAGESGLGFQVIANEIRRLADHSKLSLKTIQDRLQVIGEVLNDVQTSSEATVTLARDQAASSEELSSFVNMIESITAELDSFRNT